MEEPVPKPEKTALFPFLHGCAFEQLYKDKSSHETFEGYRVRDLHEDAIYRLVALMETHSA